MNDIFEVVNVSNDGTMEVKTTVNNPSLNKNYEYTFIVFADNHVFIHARDLLNKNNKANSSAWSLDTKTGKMGQVSPEWLESHRERIRHQKASPRTTDPFKGVDENVRQTPGVQTTGDLYHELAESISALKDENFRLKT